MNTIRQTLTTCGKLLMAFLARTAMVSAAELALLAPPCAHAGVDWKPVDAEAVSLQTPQVDQDARAEYARTRIKVFNNLGRKQGTVSIPYLGKDRTREASGRTTNRVARRRKGPRMPSSTGRWSKSTGEQSPTLSAYVNISWAVDREAAGNSSV